MQILLFWLGVAVTPQGLNLEVSTRGRSLSHGDIPRFLNVNLPGVTPTSTLSSVTSHDLSIRLRRLRHFGSSLASGRDVGSEVNISSDHDMPAAEARFTVS